MGGHGALGEDLVGEDVLHAGHVVAPHHHPHTQGLPQPNQMYYSCNSSLNRKKFQLFNQVETFFEWTIMLFSFKLILLHLTGIVPLTRFCKLFIKGCNGYPARKPGLFSSKNNYLV